MRGGSLRRFKVYVPNEQGGGGLMRWQTPSPYAPPPFIGSLGDPQIGAGVKDMAKDFLKGVKGGQKAFVIRSAARYKERGFPSAQEQIEEKSCQEVERYFWRIKHGPHQHRTSK